MKKLLVRLALRLRDRVTRRPPDLILKRHDGKTYMRRWYVLPRNKVLCLYLHQFVSSDDDRALHDHPGRNFSFIVEGGYDEVTPEGTLRRSAGEFVTRPAEALHRVQLLRYSFEGEEPEEWRTDVRRGEMPCWTLFVFGPKYREWGFSCPRGWVPHWRFNSQGGCGEHD